MPTPEQVREIAEAIYRREAPGHGDAGNVKPYEELPGWDKRRYEDIVTIVIDKWEAMAGVAAQMAEDHRGG